MKNDYKWIALFLCGIIVCSFALLIAPASITYAGSASVTRQQIPPPAPFLFPPFYGAKRIAAIFDHRLPTYDANIDVVHFNGQVFNNLNLEEGEEPADFTPGGCKGVAHCYDGHNGIDFGGFDSERDPILASAAGEVLYAGWADPTYRQSVGGTDIRWHK